MTYPIGRLVPPLLVAMALVACVDERHRVGTTDRFVTLEQTVVDSFGVSQPALCADFVTFEGEIDASCIGAPMIWSYARRAELHCSYLDAQSRDHDFVDEVAFDEGYVHEPDCEGRTRAPVDAGAPDASPIGRV